MNKQTEITQKTNLLNEDGSVAVKGWARRDLFEYDRKFCKPRWRLKEWDYYQISDGEMLIQILFSNISVGASALATLINMKTGKRLTSVYLVPFTKNRFFLPKKSDTPNFFRFERGGTVLQFDTRDDCKKLEYKGLANGKTIKMNFTLDLMDDHENITIVTPFEKKNNQFFMTTKQNCMPASGEITWGKQKWTFDKSNTFACLDWGRGVWPHKNHWYWGNGSTYIDGKLFGFEITWGIGDESNATETCLFYDGKAHKIGAVDVDEFPKGKWMEPWHFVSEDGRFDVTMTPFFDNHSGVIICDLGLDSHQVHGLWNGFAILDDGTKLEIKDMYAFCEYVENRW